MGLNRNANSILAYFRSEAPANRAAQLMVQYGFPDITVDVIVPVPGRTVYSSPASSLTTLVRGADSPPKSNLQAPQEAGADVSGPTTGEPVSWAGYTHMLAVTVAAGQTATVKALLKELGACL